MGHVGSNKKLTNANPLDVAIVDGSGDQITSFGGGSGGTAHTDDAAFSIGSAASVTPAGFLADEAAPDSVDEGDMGVARMTLNRLQLTVISDAASEKRVGVIDLATRDALAVAIVDASGDQIASFGGGTQYTEDAAAAANPVGTALILIREDARAGSLVSADGDNVAARGNDKGELYVKHTDAIPVTDNSGSLTVDNGGTFAVQATLAAGAAAIAKAEDAASANADVGVPAMAVQTATPVNTAGADGDYEFLQMSAGRLWASAKIDTALPAGSNAIGKLAANSGVIIGAIEIAAAQTLATVTNLATIGTSVTPGVAAGNLGKAEDAAHSSSDTGVMLLAVREATATDLSAGNTDGDYEPLQVDANGKLWVNPGTVTVAAHAVTNAGTFAVQESGTHVQVDDAAFTPATSKIVMAGFEADEGSTDSVDEGDGGAARMTLDRKQIVTIQPHTAGGLSTFMASGSDGSTALTNSAQAISAAAGQVYGWFIYNPNAAAQFVHFYNTAAGSVTVGTTNPLFTLTIPATAAANVNMVQGILFTNTGFSMAATSTAGGNGAPSTAFDAVVFYK